MIVVGESAYSCLEMNEEHVSFCSSIPKEAQICHEIYDEQEQMALSIFRIGFFESTKA